MVGIRLPGTKPMCATSQVTYLQKTRDFFRRLRQRAKRAFDRNRDLVQIIQIGAAVAAGVGSVVTIVDFILRHRPH